MFGSGERPFEPGKIRRNLGSPATKQLAANLGEE